MVIESRQSSHYLDYLPAVYQQDATVEQPNFLGRFLLTFEQILTGLGEVNEPGLEEVLDGLIDPVSGTLRMAGLHRYFEPGPGLADTARAPTEFLEWLASWVALTLRADLDEATQRKLIANAVHLYSLHGTKRGLEETLSIYTPLTVTINELNTPFQLGVHATIGTDTILDGGAPHFFRVLLRLPTLDLEPKYKELVTAIIELEKPAHTYYALDVDTPSLQIGIYSTVGVDTLLRLRLPVLLAEQED